VSEPSTGRDSSLTVAVLLRHIVAYLPGTILPALLSFLFLFLFTRIFDPTDFGRYSLVLSVVGMLTVGTAKWLETGINRYLAAADDDVAARRVAHGATLGFAAAALVIMVSGLLLGSLLHLPAAWAGFLLPATLFWAGLTVYEPLSVVFQAQLRPGAYSSLQLARSALRLGLGLLLVLWIARSPVYLLWGEALSLLLLIVPAWHASGLGGPGFLLDRQLRARSIGVLRSLAVYGGPMAGWFLGSQLLNVGDRYVLLAYRGAAEVGLYSASYDLVARSISVLAMPILLAAHPLLMKAWGRDDRSDAARWLGHITGRFVVVGSMATAGAWLFSADLARWFLGPSFFEGHRIMAVIVAGVTLWNLGMYVHKPFEFQERTLSLFTLSLAAAGFNLGLNFLLVPPFGYVGAAYATLASYLAYVLVVAVAGRRLLSWHVPWRSLLPPLAGVLLTAALTDAARRAWSGHVGTNVAALLSMGLFGGLSALILAWLARLSSPEGA
jgi:O-antigen/teichoic acid export membrane protein